MSTGRITNASWYLVIDQYEFHVYVVVMANNPKEGIVLSERIDWHQDSILTQKPYEPGKQGENRVFIGFADYCKECIKRKMSNILIEYNLFRFNCRKVSYILLTEIAGFERDVVEEHFYKFNVLCGTTGNDLDCLSIDEIKHYIRFKRGGG